MNEKLDTPLSPKKGRKINYADIYHYTNEKETNY